MASAPYSTHQPCIALFDLDGTLTWRDTLLPFLAGFLRRHPARTWRVLALPSALLAYAVSRDRGRLKSRVIRAIMGGAGRHSVDAWADEFVSTLIPRGLLRADALAAVKAHRLAGHRLVLLSASPDLYVPRIGRLLGFERTVCTEIEWTGDTLDGRLKSLNRQGEEKSRCLVWIRTRYPGVPVKAYGNSASDLPHMRLAEGALLVNAGAAARRDAARSGIPVADWH